MAESSTSLTGLFIFKPEIEGRKCLPIVYNKSYDISFWSLESWHPFDTGKWGKIHNQIKEYFQVLKLLKFDFIYRLLFSVE